MQGGTSTGQAGPVLQHAELEQLRTLLASKESTITMNQMRISKLESLHRLAQESAVKCEAELVSCHEALSKAQVENQKLCAEAQQSR
jgi:hypothetical protein